MRTYYSYVIRINEKIMIIKLNLFNQTDFIPTYFVRVLFMDLDPDHSV